MDMDKKSPEAIAIIARLKKKRGKPADEGDEETDGEDEGGDVSEEAKLAAAESVLQAIKDKDAEALKEALTDFYDACGE
jgi:hypothetical protein